MPGPPRRSRRQQDSDLDREMRGYIEALTQEKIRAGASPEAARRAAMAEVVGVEHVKEAVRDARAGVWIERLVQDVRYGVRSLRHAPAFTWAVIAVLALGIGANATMFGVIDRLLLRPPAQVRDPARVVSVQFVRTVEGRENRQDYLSFPIYLEAKSATDAFGDVAAYTPSNVSMGTGPDARPLQGMRVSANFFSLLGVRPAAGRFFVAAEDQPSPPNVVVISHGLWQREFAGAASVVGQTMPIGDAPFTIVGVAPEGFTGLARTAVDVWVPLTTGVAAQEYARWTAGRDAFWLLAVGRLEDGVTPERAAAAATLPLREGLRRGGMSEARIAERQPRIGLVSVLPREALAGDPDAKVAMLLGLVSVLVFGIACANVSSLQLARALRRRREMALRATLGATRRRLLAQLAAETMVLALAGGVAALLVARLGATLVRDVLFTSFDWSVSVTDGRLLGFTLLASVVAGLVIGVLPLRHALVADLTPALKDGARAGHGGRTRTRAVLLVVQTALSVMLLVGTGLFVRSLAQVRRLPVGMETERVLLADVRTTGMPYTTAQRLALYDALERSARRLPGVEQAALATSLPFYMSWAERVRLPGRDSVPTVRDGGPYFTGVSDGFFTTMGMRLLEGRGVEAGDRAGTARVAVVNESMARLYWPGTSAIGQCLLIGDDAASCTQVVGVVANARRQNLIEDPSLQFFLPIEQAPAWVDTRVLVLRPSAGARAAVQSLRDALQRADAGLPYVRLRPLDDLIAPETRSWRLGATMFAAFGVLALVLAAVGLYGLLTYDVGQRRHEIGVRVALGASAGEITRHIFADGLRLVAAGAVVGIALTLAAGRFVEPLLFETSARDPRIIAGVVALLFAVALLAMLPPTRRAVRVDPVGVLRGEG